MGSRFTRISLSINVLLLAAIACQVQVLPPPTFTPRPASELTLISLIQTLTAQAAAVSTTVVPSVFTATPTLPPPIAEATATPIIPPTDTIIPSPVIPLVSVSTDTNCRTGPSKFYKFVGKADVGTKFVVVGKNTLTNYWIIKLADGRECWLWGQYATLEGNVNGLPEYSPPAFGRIEGEVRKSSASNAAKMAQAFVDIGLGFDVYETGNDGVFFFEDVPVGEVKISVTHSGFYFPKKSVFVSAGQVSTIIIIPAPPIILPPPTPTRSSSCPVLQPNCLFLPTQGPALP